MDDVHFRCNPSVVAATVGSELVLLESERGTYFGLSVVAARFWQLACQGHSLVAIHRHLCQEFDAPEEQIVADTRTLVEELIRHGLLMTASES